ncbi:MAG: hypothetical protein RIQ60_2019 [Pseudomonadota bacterium]|jgi:hypothetical protein
MPRITCPSLLPTHPVELPELVRNPTCPCRRALRPTPATDSSR